MACASPPYDAGTLLQSHPELGRLQARALARARPYLLPAAGRITWFTCRHDTSLPVLVSLARGATEAEEAALDVALAALDRTVESLRFVRVPPDEAVIQVEFVDGLVAREGGEDQANTITDCALGPGAITGDVAQLPAQIAAARVRIGRGGPSDPLGRQRRLSGAELAGVVVHELGHALGLAGHSERGGIMSRSLTALAVVGEQALGRDPLEAPALTALYALPTGTVLARASISPARTHLVDRLARLDTAEGPFVRVGDALARIYWRDARAREYGVQVVRLDELMREPGGLVLLPEARTRRALPRANDPLPGG